MITDLRKQLDRMPMPERLRRPRTPKELEAAEKKRERKLERALGRRRGPKPTESTEELERPVDVTVVPSLRTKILRHTYTAARLQTTDRGQPIALYTVARELGHQGADMVEEVYAHLGRFRHRGEQVEYRW
jgi:integrase